MSARMFVVVFAVLLVVLIGASLPRDESNAGVKTASAPENPKSRLRCPNAEASSGDVVDLTGVSSMWKIDRPTYAPVLTKRTEPRFTREEWERCLSGVVIAELLVGPDGKVTNGRVLRGLSQGLDASAAKATKDWQYIPAVTGTDPVPATTTAVIWFNPNSPSQQPGTDD